MCERPCDTEEPTADVREQFARFVEQRNRWHDAKVTDLTDYRRKRIMEQQLGLDLANAFRSADACPPNCVDPYCPNQGDDDGAA